MIEAICLARAISDAVAAFISAMTWSESCVSVRGSRVYDVKGSAGLTGDGLICVKVEFVVERTLLSNPIWIFLV